MTYLDAHADDANPDPADPDAPPELSSAIRKLAGLLIAVDDGYDSQVKAQDLLYGNNYADAFGGASWHYDGRADTGQGPPTPSSDEAKTLALLNEAQAVLDATNKELELKRWSLFAQWWNLVSDPLENFHNPQLKHDKYFNLVKDLVEGTDTEPGIKALDQRQKDKLSFIQTTSNLDSQGKPIISTQPTIFKRVANAPFYTRKDPTVCIAGMVSGWPAGFSDTLICRMQSQLVPGPSTLNSKAPKDLGNLQSLCQGLLEEFLTRPDLPASVTRPGWKLWNDTQPWFP